jgi:Icc-related predicted phosphoesterase
VADTTRIYLASDFHAAEKAWRKFLNAIKLNVYKADIALVAGDFTGKAIVPIVENGGLLRRAVRRPTPGGLGRGARHPRA